MTSTSRKGKGEVASVLATKPCDGVELQLLSFLVRALDAGEWTANTLRCALNWRLSGSQR
jgi:hypothetical protein